MFQVGTLEGGTDRRNRKLRRVRMYETVRGVLRRLTSLRFVYRYGLGVVVKVALDTSECAVRDMDVDIRRWVGIRIHHHLDHD